jgi:hypothetical protein
MKAVSVAFVLTVNVLDPVPTVSEVKLSTPAYPRPTGAAATAVKIMLGTTGVTGVVPAGKDVTVTDVSVVDQTNSM